MHRIDSVTAGPGNSWVDENPQLGIPATVTTADWFNAVQEEIAGVVESTGAVLDKADNGQLLAAINDIRGAPVYGKNYLFNAEFLVVNRANAQVSQSNFVEPRLHAADMWRVNPGSNGGNNATINLEAKRAVGSDIHAPGDGVRGYLTTLVNTAPTGDWGLFQRIENVLRLEGHIVTLSVKIKAFAANPGTPTVTPRIIQHFQDGDAEVTHTGPTWVLTKDGAWYDFEWTVALGSAAGKALGATVGEDYTEVRFDVSGGTVGDSLYFATPQLEDGPNSTGFEQVDETLEGLRCARYFEASGPEPWSASNQTLVYAWGNSDQLVPIAPSFLVPKRTTADMAGSFWADDGSAGQVTRYANGLTYNMGFPFNLYACTAVNPSGSPSGASGWGASWAIWDEVY